MDKDGALDRHEFTVAMHLVYKALEKHAIPNELPTELRKQNANVINKGAGAGAAAPPIPIAAPKLLDGPARPIEPPAPPVPVIPWVVTTEDKMRFDHMFTAADADKDG